MVKQKKIRDTAQLRLSEVSLLKNQYTLIEQSVIEKSLIENTFNMY